MITLFGVLLGVLLLIGGGALLVRGASEIASAHGVSPLIVGLTIVGFGTSAPELVVSVVGALRGETALAFGNVIGSNISNLGLVLGLAAIVAPITIQGDLVRRELPLLLLGTTMMAVLALDGPLEGMPAAMGRTDSIVLILMFCIFIYINGHDLLVAKQSDALLIEIKEHSTLLTASSSRARWFLLLAGFALLFAGGEVTIRSGVALATELGTSPAIIGLFVVAIGTSMPELVTSIVAAMRGEPDLAMGNVIGSNIFNSLLVLPTSGLITQIPVPTGGVCDLAVSWLFAAALIPVFYVGKAQFGRVTGAVFLAAYLSYALFRIFAGPS